MLLHVQTEEILDRIRLGDPGDKTEILPKQILVNAQGGDEEPDPLLNVLFKHLSVHIADRLGLIIPPIKQIETSPACSNKGNRK